MHAISDGPERGVRVTPLDARYWKKHYQCAVRVLPDAAVKPAATSTAAPSGDTTANGSTANGSLTNVAKQTPDAGAAQSQEPVKQPKAAATAKVSAPKTPETSAKKPVAATSAEKQSPWDTWNGFIKGDYDQWKEEQRRKLVW